MSNDPKNPQHQGGQQSDQKPGQQSQQPGRDGQQGDQKPGQKPGQQSQQPGQGVDSTAAPTSARFPRKPRLHGGALFHSGTSVPAGSGGLALAFGYQDTLRLDAPSVERESVALHVRDE